jgi:hypothetical protein
MKRITVETVFAAVSRHLNRFSEAQSSEAGSVVSEAGSLDPASRRGQ